MDPQYTATYQGNVSPEMAAGIAAFMGAFFLVMFFVLIVVYVYFAICLMKIAHKTNTPNAWLAWIPIANVILMLQVAKKPLWWIILFFIPIVNIVITIMVWMAVAKAVKKPEWLGVLMIIPIANLIVPGYLAFSNYSHPAASAPAQ